MKRRSARRRRGRRRTFKRKRRLTFGKRVRRTVLRMEDPKFITNYSGFTPTGAVPVVNAYNVMTQGTLRSSRIGNRIKLMSLKFTIRASLSPTVVGGCGLRIMCFYDKQANATAITAATLSDLFLDPTPGNWWIALRNPNTMRRYHAIYDKVHRVEVNMITNVVAGATTTESSYQFLRKFVWRLKGRTTQFNELNTGTAADVIAPVLYIALFTDGSVICNTEAMLTWRDS